VFLGDNQVTNHSFKLGSPVVKPRAIVGRVIKILFCRIPSHAAKCFRSKFQLGQDVFKGFEGWEELLVGCEHIGFEQWVSKIGLEGRLKILYQLKSRCGITELEHGINQIPAFNEIREGII